MKVEAQATLFETLADLLKNGFSLRDALQFVIDVRGTAFQCLKPACQQLAAGEGLADALQPYVAVDLYYQLLIAETHGQLMATLIKASQLMRTRVKQVKQVRRLLQYPLILIVILGLIMAVIKVAILPNFGQMEPTPAAPSPNTAALQLGLLGLGGLAVVAGGALSYYLYRLPVRRRFLWLVRLPVIGRLARLYCHYYLTFNTGMLLSSGLGLRGICEVSRQFKPQALLHQQGQFVEQQLLAGVALRDIVQSDPLLPAELAVLIQKADAQPELGQALLYLAAIQYERLINELNRMIGWIQPTLFVIIAGSVIGLYLNMLLPMYQTMGELLK
ncbi:type II secretion system F family protein [Lactiplantibacillus modestisalitolerans]|uniref:Type II secretion system F family protein n=1 Tax=Lactiplantibacillus modestisalitolerans TaxID=1457219 RepID=A0ABV5WVF2_9LACO|nr:type II secretion system F family protein [Lactiplantibacillus modestisalitolerans]